MKQRLASLLGVARGFGGDIFQSFGVATGEDNVTTATRHSAGHGGDDSAGTAHNHHHGRIWVSHKLNSEELSAL
jgi:hypothetical protein